MEMYCPRCGYETVRYSQNRNKLQQILDDHKKWLRGEGGKRADLYNADLRGVDLGNANLGIADLRNANLGNANLGNANLYNADLRGADLGIADLGNANLYGASLRGANLYNADLCGADLGIADLSAPTMVLLCNWGELSDETTLALMRLDASAHPEPARFDDWANGGNCPYDDEIQFSRVANFREKRELWKPGPPPTIWEAVKMVLDEKCPGWEKKDAT